MLPIAELCMQYDLGEKLEMLEIVPGGLLHKLWRLQTEKGQFAIKEINPSHQAQLAHNLLQPQKAQKIAVKMQKLGVSTVTALLSHQHEYTINNQGIDYIVMPWIEGRNLKLNEISLSMTEHIGELLAFIHESNIQDNTLAPPQWIGYSRDHWITLLDSGKRHAIIKKLDLAKLVAWSELAKSSQHFLQQELVLSHRDLDAKNVLWKSTSKAILLDWEYAGLINPMLDLFIVALNWSDVTSGNINWQRFAAIILGYEKSQSFTLTEPVLFGYYGYCLDWLEFNLRRLGETENIALQEIIGTYKALEAVTQARWFL